MPEENLPQSDIDALLAAMRRESIRQRRHKRFDMVCTCVMPILMIVYICGNFLHSKQILTLYVISFFLPFLAAKYLNNARRKKTVAILAKANDVRLVGPLCDALGFRDKSMAKIARETLTELLPRLQASDAHLLNREQRKNLHGELTGRDTPFILAILKALEQIGDEKALMYVEIVAKSKPRIRPDARIQEAAQNCLPFLYERAAAQKSGQDLLRASSPDANSADLLRPASAHETEPQELLRASGRVAE